MQGPPLALAIQRPKLLREGRERIGQAGFVVPNPMLIAVALHNSSAARLLQLVSDPALRRQRMQRPGKRLGRLQPALLLHQQFTSGKPVPTQPGIERTTALLSRQSLVGFTDSAQALAQQVMATGMVGLQRQQPT